jgi:hypothetical protein
MCHATAVPTIETELELDEEVEMSTLSTTVEGNGRALAP